MESIGAKWPTCESKLGEDDSQSIEYDLSVLVPISLFDATDKVIQDGLIIFGRRSVYLRHFLLMVLDAGHFLLHLLVIVLV